MLNKEEHYLGNPLLKRANVSVELTQDQVVELVKCAEDPLYFAKNYIKIVTLDEGLVNFEPYPFQEVMIKNFYEKRFNICKLPRQSGKTTTTVAFLIHNMLFNEHTSIAILANKAQTAKEILSRLQTAYENLPKWMQMGVKSCNKTSMELENGSKVIAASTSASAVRGGTYSLLMLDEYAFVPEQIANNFMRSVYPTISSGDSSKVIVVSCVTKDTYILTPKGYRRIETLLDQQKEGAYIVPEYTIRGNNKFYSSNIVVNNKKSPTNIIQTRYDSIECSEDHKLWAYQNGSYGYVRSKDLKVGDCIAVRFNTQVFGDNHSKSEDDAYEYGLKVKQGLIDILSGEVLSWCKDNIVKLLEGLFSNNFYIEKSSFSSNNKELLRQVQLLLSNLGVIGFIENNIIVIGDKTNKDYCIDKNDNTLIWFEIKSIEKSENEVFDVSLPDIPGDKWCHSVLYNNFLGHQTPQGMNHFYKLWMGAKEGKNGYFPFEIHWSDVPGRDEKWKQEQIANTSQKDFDQEFNTEFLGSSDTLISGSKLANIVTKNPIRSINSLDIYEEPKEESVYVTIVDTARGVEKDYHAFTVIDISVPPYKVVAKYRNNEIKPEMYSYVVKDVAFKYNQSFLLCEVNDIGNQVAKDLVDDGYPNMLMCSTKSRSGQFIGQNFSGKYELGVKMQKNIKKIGCLKLKTLIEENILLINDRDIFAELTTFIQKGSTFEAEMGKNDDLVACLVLFAWLTTNQYFKDIVDIDLRKRLLEQKKDKEEADILPFGFMGTDDNEIIDEKSGNIWQVVEQDEMNAMLSLFNYY